MKPVQFVVEYFEEHLKVEDFGLQLDLHRLQQPFVAIFK